MTPQTAGAWSREAPKTRWPNLWSWLTGEPIVSPLDLRLREAVAERDAAFKARDYRRYGRALMVLQQVQSERLRAEAGR